MKRKLVRALALFLALLSLLNAPVLAAGLGLPRGSEEMKLSERLFSKKEKGRSSRKKKSKKSKKASKSQKKAVTGKVDNATDLPDGTYTLRAGDYTVKATGKVSVRVPSVTVRKGHAVATVEICDKQRTTLDAAGKLFKGKAGSGKAVFTGVPITPGKTVQMLAVSKKDAVKVSVKITFVPALDAESTDAMTAEEATEEGELPAEPAAEETPAEPAEEETPAEPAEEETPAEPAEEETPAEPAEEETPAEPTEEETPAEPAEEETPEEPTEEETPAEPAEEETPAEPAEEEIPEEPTEEETPAEPAEEETPEEPAEEETPEEPEAEETPAEPAEEEPPADGEADAEKETEKAANAVTPKPGETYSVEIECGNKMFKVESPAVVTMLDNGAFAMRYTLNANARRSYVAVGGTSAAEAHSIPWYPDESSGGHSVFTIPVSLDENGTGSVTVTYQRSETTFSNECTIRILGNLQPSSEPAATLKPFIRSTYAVSVASSGPYPADETAIVTLLSGSKYAMRFSVKTSSALSYAAVGSVEEAQAHSAAWYAAESGNTFTVPVTLDKSGNGSVSVTYRDGETAWSELCRITVSGPMKNTDAADAALSPVYKGTADYSAVDAALLEVPEDLSIYTEESVKALQAAIDAVDRTLDSADQAAVDAMAKAITDAIAALEKLPEENGLLILKADGSVYLMLRITEYKATTDGKKIKLVFKTTHETYAKGISLSKVSKISKIKKCYIRAKNTAFTITVPYDKRGAKIPMVIMTDKGWKNEQYYLWVPSNPKKVSKPIKDAPMTPCDGGSYDPEDPADPLDGTTSAIDNSTNLPDGEYKADKFTFSGGSGRTTIYCEKVIVKNGKSFAVIAFGSMNYPYIKAAGKKFDTSRSGGRSRATIPVKLDAINTIIGMTTAMSQPHEITYSIFIHVNNPAGEEEKPPEQKIPGLVYRSTDKNTAAELFAIHRYDGGYVIIDVAGVGWYLVVPAGKEAPDLVDENIIVVRQPASNVYVGQKDTFDMLLSIDEAHIRSVVTQAGFEDDAALTFSGSCSEVDFAQLVRSRSSLAILPGTYADGRVTGRAAGENIRRSDLSDADAAGLSRMFEGFNGLGIPPFVDRSADESSAQARSEWLRVYGILLGCEKQADNAFRSSVK